MTSESFAPDNQLHGNCYRFRVQGRVQGVGFRFFTQTEGRRHKLLGWVRNEADGSVSGLVFSPTGSEQALRSFHQALTQGPPAGRVDQVDWSPAEPPPGLTAFDIRY